MKLSKFSLPIIIVLVSLACGQLSVGVETPISTDTLVDEMAEATLAALDNQEAVLPDPDLNDGGPIWLENEEIPTGLTFPEYLAGLVYVSDGVWVVDKNGLSHLAFGQPFSGGAFSPDGTDYLYSSTMNEGEDILLFNLASGEVNQLTDTPTVFERGYQWWPARDNIIVFQFIPEDMLGPWNGFLGAYDLLTGEYIIIDDQQGSSSSFALSPDGEKIAYIEGKQPVVYTWGQGSTTIDTEGLGLEFTSFSSPAWSPDGKKIAFHAAGGPQDETSGAYQSATVIIDLENNSANVLHEYFQMGQRGGPEIVWNPNGEWLAVVNPGEIVVDGSPMIMWLMREDGSEEIHFGFSTSPRWSPDGKYLTYIEWPPVGVTEAHSIKMIEVGVWEPVILEDLEGDYIIDWIALPE